MLYFTPILGALLALAGCCAAVPTTKHNKRSFVDRGGVIYNVFEHGATGARMEFVENSGICEMTPGVRQVSGYLSVGENMNMWFWYNAQNSLP
jgi:carboxypeptidase D